jgi:hypothetical protein
MSSRRIVGDLDEDARDVARRKMKTKAFLKSRDPRKRVKMRFAHLKTHHRFERMRLRGLSGARDEFHLAAKSEPQDTGAAAHPSATTAHLGVSCVASVGGVGVKAEARMGRSPKDMTTPVPDQAHGQALTPPTAAFFDSIGQTLLVPGPGEHVRSTSVICRNRRGAANGR